MPSRFTQLGGALGADQALREIIQQKILQEQAAQKQQMDVYKLGQDDRRINVSEGQLGLGQQEFGQKQQEYAEAAPARQAGVLYTQAQTQDLQGKPLRDADARAQQGLMAESAHQNRLGEIKAQGDQSARVAGIRTADTGNDRLVQVMGPDGTPIWTKESQAAGKPAAQAPRAVTGAERQTLSYYNRAKQATADIEPIEDTIAGQGIMGQLQGQYAPNMMQNETQQRYRQAQRSFTEARLRKESGAAIPTAEYENDARTYFAQPGDSQSVKDQKRKARAVVLEGMRNSSGRAYEEFYGSDGQPKAAPASGGVTIKSIRQVK